MSIFEPESLAIFREYSKIAQKALNIYNNDNVVASDRAALRVSVMQWRLEVIISTVQHNECSFSLWDSHQQEVS